MRSTIITNIEAAKVVAIIRSEHGEDVRLAINNLIAAGVKALEITSNTPDFCEHITWARKTYPEAVIGAGTVINVSIAQQAIKAGSQFLVTPNMNADVIKVAQANGNATLMGAMTPTDVATGIENGADFVKLFPAGPLGIAYFKALLGPFKGAKFIAVGGINAANAADWLAAGAVGLGIGGSFTNGPADVIKQTVKKLFEQLK